jgi:ABC-type transport system substrate-binding protein
MRRLQSLFFVLGVLAILSLLSACGASGDSATTTLAPTTTTLAPITTTLAPITTTLAPITTTLAPTTTLSSIEGQGPTELSDVPRMTVEELKESLDDGEEIVVVDTRGGSSYSGGHIAGAIVETPGYFDEFPHDQEIVLYCA